MFMNWRVRINFVIDLGGFLLLVLMVATGFILHFILPAGSGRILGEGIGSASGMRPVLLLWGLTRHEWGQIHFWISIGFLALMSCHLILHWSWLLCMVRGKERTGSAGKFALGVLGLLALLAIAAAPFFSPVQSLSRQALEAERFGEPLADEPQDGSQPSLHQQRRLKGGEQR